MMFAAGCGSSSHQSASTSTPATSTAITPTTSQSPSASTSPAAAPTAANTCGSAPTAPTYKHVIWIFFENHSYSTVIGSSDAPYINSVADECGLATNYHNVTHPSLPNYISATSGLDLASLDPFTGDCDPTGNCTTDTQSNLRPGRVVEGVRGLHAFQL